MKSNQDVFKESIEDTILEAYNRWSIRNDEQYLTRFETAKGEELKKLQEEVRQDTLLMTKRTMIPGFARHVSACLRKNSVVKAQSRRLLKACLLSIIKEPGAKIDEVIKKKTRSSGSSRSTVSRGGNNTKALPTLCPRGI